MTIIIDQKFPRCDVCGKMIPIGSTPLEVAGKNLKLCSEWCREYRKKYYQ